MPEKVEKLIQIPVGKACIEGMLELPEHAHGLVLFAHGSGSSRHSPRNNYVAGVLREHGLGTLLMDLLTPEEDTNYQTRFDIPLLTERLLDVTRWLKGEKFTQHLPVGLFGASTGAAAAIQAAARLGEAVGAVVSRGGRPDLAGVEDLINLKSPTLLLVGGWDEVVIRLNQEAYDLMTCQKELVIIPGATHLFDEPGTLEQVAHHAASWFVRYLKTA